MHLHAGLAPIYQAVKRAVSDSSMPDLTMRQMGIMLVIADVPENTKLSVKHVHIALGVQKPVVTRAVDRLTEFDLVTRKIDPLDRRMVRLSLTQKGRAFLNKLAPRVKGIAELSAAA